MLASMAKTALLAKLTAKEGTRDDLLAAIRKMVAYVDSDEPGTEIYAAHEDVNDENVVWFYELYTDSDAQGVHGGSDMMKTVGKEMGQFMAGRPELIFLNPVTVSGFDL